LGGEGVEVGLDVGPGEGEEEGGGGEVHVILLKGIS
jgi:hypothetical protein